MYGEFDYIVVGSGAGGGPLACNLASAEPGFRVALLEAGEDARSEPGSPSDYSTAVPALHPYASEDAKHSWAYFVEHYQDAKQQAADWKRRDGKGVFYPRAGALGGCTAIHALITLYPHNADWDNLKCVTGDPSWSAEKMRGYFEKLEEWLDAPVKPPAHIRDPISRRGLVGWLPITLPDPALVLHDSQLLKIAIWAFLIGTLVVEKPKGHLIPLDAKEPEAVAEALLTRLESAVLHGRRLPEEIAGLFAKVRETIARLKHDKLDLFKTLAALAENVDLLALFQALHTHFDPNRWFDKDADRVGAFSLPLSTLHGVRSAVRERVLQVRARYPERLILIPNALVTEVIIEGGRAVGIRYLQGRAGKSLYGAARDADRSTQPAKKQEIRIRPKGEVILACGSFNTPQVLMLSGVGPASQLKNQGIEIRCGKDNVGLPGVGQNLHDRYEVSLVFEVPRDFSLLEGARFTPPSAIHPEDQPMSEWVNHRGIYTTNGVLLCVLLRSSKAQGPEADLCLFGLPGNFRGYYPNYSRDIMSEEANGKRVPNHRRFTWTILKGRTINRAGTVCLRSPDPRQPPEVQFHYFSEGTKGWQNDLDTMVEGVQLAAKIMQSTGLKASLDYPKIDLANTPAVRAYIQNEAWGHHACGTCKIGDLKDRNTVLDSSFRVRGVKGLRVVDASVFPAIPGFFLAAPVYMISEKASQVVLAARAQPAGQWPEAPNE